VVVQLRRSSGGMQILTLGDYLEQMLGERGRVIRFVSALVIVFFMEVYVVAQFVGTGKQVDGMGISVMGQVFGYNSGVILGGLIIGIYVLIGGYAAVCWTDMLQGVLMALVMVAFPFIALQHAGGASAVAERLPEANLAFWDGGKGVTWAALGFALSQLGIGIGYPGMPHSIIRFITVRDERAARNAAIIGLGWGALVLTGAVTLGVVGRALIPELADPEQILPAFTAAYFHPVIGGIIWAAVSAAIMSTADSQLMMAATAAIHDVWGVLRGRQPADARSTIQTRGLIGLLSVIALLLALIEPQVIYTFVLFAWGALGASFTPVILLSLHWRTTARDATTHRDVERSKLTWQGGLASFVLGPLTVMLWKVSGLSDTLYELFPAAIISTIAAMVVSNRTRR
jgi:Na+/proline symporter